MVTGLAMLTGTVSGGLLGSLDLALPYMVRSVLLAAVFVVALLTMHDWGFTPRTLRASDLPAEMKKVARASLTYGWQRRSIRLLMICSFLQFAFLTWGWHAWQPYFLELLGRDAVWVAGVIAALISVSTILGNLLVDGFSRFCGKRTTLLLSAAAIQTAAAVGVGLAGSFWLAVPLFLVVTGTMGVIGPVKQAYLHAVIPSDQRASVLSFDSMLGNMGAGVGQAGLGMVTRARSIAAGFVVGGLTTVLVLPVLAGLRRLGEPVWQPFCASRASTILMTGSTRLLSIRIRARRWPTSRLLEMTSAAGNSTSRSPSSRPRSRRCPNMWSRWSYTSGSFSACAVPTRRSRSP